MDVHEQDLATVQQLIDRHFEIWNDTDPARRALRHAALYTHDVFVADYAGSARGHAQVDAKLAGLQQRFAGFTFRPAPAAWNHGIGRVTWSYGPDEDPGRVRGEDIFTIEDGKLASLRVFIDNPQPQRTAA